MPRVVIVGAGPGGAALAYLLARRGLEVALLERATDFSREFRGELLLPSGLDAFAQMGLLPELEAVSHVEIEQFHLYVQGRRSGAVSFDEDVFGGHRPHWMSQPELLEMLVAQAGAYPGFSLARGVAARSLVEEQGRIVGVRALYDDGERDVLGDLVVGADGRSSMVRRRGGLPERADPTPMDVVWCKLPLPAFAEGPVTARAYVGSGHLLIAAPVYDGLQVAWVIRKGAFGEIRERGMPECLDRMADHVSPDLAAHLRAHREDAISPFLLSTVSDRVLEWTRPGMLVIGDAAHTMSPVGAQGLNIALRDALVAANHLVPVLEAGGDPAALDAACRRIAAEREPEVRRIQRAQARPPQVILRDNLLSRLVLWLLPRFIGNRSARFSRAPLARDFLFGVGRVKLEV